MKNHSLIFNLSKFPLSQRPVGAYRISHFLREHNWDCEVIEYALFWPLDKLKILIESRINQNTKFIGLSHLFYAWTETFDIFLTWIKMKYPHIKIISGSAAYPGFHSNNIDYYIRGYGENALLTLLKYIFSNGPEPVYSMRFFGQKKVIDAIHSYPAYPLSSLMIKYEDRDFIESNEWLGIEFSRGCKFRCAFCNYPILGVKGDYSRDSLDAKIQLKDAYERFGVTNYVVSDDTFNDRTEKIIKFADEFETLDFKPWFTGFIRADLLAKNKDQKIHLSRMGFNGHYYGIESFNRPSAKAIGKGMAPEEIQEELLETKDYINRFNENQYRSTIGLIIGLPEESFETIEKTKKWLINNWQGQNFIAWGLEIYNPNGSENLSRLSLNYEQYGYSFVNDPDQENKKKRLISEKYDPLGERFIWKNSQMDFYQAQKIANELNELKLIYDFRSSPFDLHSDQIANPTLTLPELIHKPSKDLNDHSSIDINFFTEKYILKKLKI
jgi:radical SAM superfamily enzyme YgiQ (UPF0313 family)